MAYTEEKRNEVFEYICQQIEIGRSLRSILKNDNDMPSSSTFFIWLTENELKSKRYELATDLRTDALFDEIVEIAYNTEQGITTKVNQKGEFEETTGDMLGHRRLKIDALKWSLSKLNPKKYGDKTEVSLSNKEVTEIILTDATKDSNT
jgi:hypothetical protein